MITLGMTWPLWLVLTIFFLLIYTYRKQKEKELKAQFVITGATVGCLTAAFMVATIVSCILTLVSIILRIFFHI